MPEFILARAPYVAAQANARASKYSLVHEVILKSLHRLKLLDSDLSTETRFLRETILTEVTTTACTKPNGSRENRRHNTSLVLVPKISPRQSLSAVVINFPGYHKSKNYIYSSHDGGRMEGNYERH